MSKTYNFYYVYSYLREDETPYYIGKGQRWRMNQKHNNVGMPPRERRVKLKENLTEEEAHQYEIELIKKYGRKGLDEGGILRNTSIGGEGFTKWRTLEERKKVKSECDKRYREDPRYKDKILQQKKEYHEKHKEERNCKLRELRATPEGKAKKAFMDKRYAEQVKKDPEKLERRRKISRESALRNSRKRGVKPREECGRKFKVVSPEGKVYEGTNCQPFAKEYGLNPQSFTAMVRGELNHCLGWTRFGFVPPEGYKWNGHRFDKIHKQSKTQRLFKIMDPEGKIWEGENQSLFSDEHGLDKRNLNAVLLGRKKSHKGWTRVEETEQNSSVDLMKFFE